MGIVVYYRQSSVCNYDNNNCNGAFSNDLVLNYDFYLDFKQGHPKGVLVF